MFCLAKNQATTHCVLEVDAPLEVARERNASRTTDRLADEVFLDLWRRYEAPDEKNRWDSPLFRVDFAGEVRPVDELAGLLNRADLAEARGEPSAVVVGGCGGGGGGGGGGGADGSGASSASSVPTATPVAVRSGFKRAPKPSAPAPTPPTLPAPSIDVDFLPEDAMRAGSESGVESEGEDGSDAWSGGGPGSEAEERRSRAGSLGEGRGALLDAEEARRTESTAVSETAVLDAVVKCVLEGRRHRPNHSTLVVRRTGQEGGRGVAVPFFDLPLSLSFAPRGPSLGLRRTREGGTLGSLFPTHPPSSSSSRTCSERSVPVPVPSLLLLRSAEPGGVERLPSRDGPAHERDRECTRLCARNGHRGGQRASPARWRSDGAAPAACDRVGAAATATPVPAPAGTATSRLPRGGGGPLRRVRERGPPRTRCRVSSAAGQW